MSIGNEIKKLMIDNATTLTKVANFIAEKKQKHYTVQNLSSKLKKGTLNANEIEYVLEFLGYSINFEKNN